MIHMEHEARLNYQGGMAGIAPENDHIARPPLIKGHLLVGNSQAVKHFPALLITHNRAAAQVG